MGVGSESHMIIPSSSTANATSGATFGCWVAHAAFIAAMIAPSSTRRSALGSLGDCPCFAVRMIVVLSVQSVGCAIRCTIAANLVVDVVERLAQQRTGRAVGVVAAGRAHSEAGSFSAVDTVWKFMPKIAGVPTCCVPEWSKPSISFRTAATLMLSYSWVSALSVVQSSPRRRRRC